MSNTAPAGGTAPAAEASVEIGKRESHEPPSRYYRGDWEAPDALLVAYDAEWSGSLVTLITAAAKEVDVFVVASAQELRDYAFFDWLSSHDADVIVVDHDTPWIRDYGPINVVDSDGTYHWLDFRYSDERPRDDLAPGELADRLQVSVEQQSEWLDGGAIVSNGNGLCAITDHSLGTLGIDESDGAAFEHFLNVIGCDGLAVIPALPEEETGHADLIAQFLSDDVVVIAEAEIAGPVADALESAVSTIRDAARALNQTIHVVRVPLAVEQRVFYSYVNVTRLRSQLLVPRFATVAELEAKAYRVFREALPGIELVPIAADAMARRGGAIHCVTLTLNVPSSVYQPRLLAQRTVRPARRWFGVDGTNNALPRDDPSREVPVLP